jgi:ABC-2 type transport system permease protein
MRRFLVLLKKELRELMTPQMLVPLLMTALIFTFIGDVVGSEQEKAEGSRAVAILDMDESAAAQAVADAFEQGGFEVVELDADASSVEEVVEDSPEPQTLVIPEGFEESLGSDSPVPIEIHARVESFSVAGLQDTGQVRGVLESVNDALSTQLIAQAAPDQDPADLKRPIALEEHVAVGGASMLGSPESVEGFVIQQTVFVPIILFIVIMFSSQMIATTIAAEKENKTLETLLASPVSRGALVTAKMVAASLVALLAAGVYLAALQRYMEGVSGGAISTAGGADVMGELGLRLGAMDWALIGVTLFLGILCALSIALILGSFADSVRSVGAIMAPMMVLLMVPYLLVILLDFNSLSPVLKTAVMAIPFTYPFVAMPNLMLDNSTIVYWGIAYEAVWFAVFATIAARIFSSDRIMTMRLRLPKRGRSGARQQDA